MSNQYNHAPMSYKDTYPKIKIKKALQRTILGYSKNSKERMQTIKFYGAENSMNRIRSHQGTPNI